VTGPDRLDEAAATSRACADELGTAFHGLLDLSADAWSCPAATAFDGQLRMRIAVLLGAAEDLRATASGFETAAAAARAAAEVTVGGPT
jgi:hypothetical protein